MHVEAKTVDDSRTETVYLVRPTHLNGANRLFGGVLGFLESIPVTLALTVALQLYMTFAGAHSVITLQDIENTARLMADYIIERGEENA